MRRLKRIGLPVLLLLFVSCSDWLDLRPIDGLVQDEYWKTKEDVSAVLMGAYYQLTQMDELLFQLGEIRGDMVIQDNGATNDIKNIFQGNIYPDNSLCDWSDFYKIIDYCNFVIKYCPIVREIDQTFTEYQMLGLESEALFLRSLAYFYLVRVFKDVPLIVDPSESDNVDFFPEKTADTTILRIIEEDLLTARKYVTEEYGSAENNLGRASKNAINALLADISLWNFEYEKVIDYISDIESSTVLLLPSSQWFSSFYPGNSLEGIFEVQFSTKLDQNNTLYGATYTSNRYLASNNAIVLLSSSTAKEIIRGDGSFHPTTKKIWKYCGSSADGKSTRPGTERYSANWIVYRYADIVLMKAEALSQLGRFDEAIDCVNEIRDRALMSRLSAPGDKVSFEDIIMDERAKELAFEGKRWFDLLRMGRRNDYARKDKLVSIIVQNYPSNQRLVFAAKLANPLGWYLPIEEEELKRNKNLVQNPYYDAF